MNRLAWEVIGVLIFVSLFVALLWGASQWVTFVGVVVGPAARGG